MVKADKAFIVLCLVLISAIGWFRTLGTVQPQELSLPFIQFPTKIGDFTLVGSQQFGEDVVKTAGMDDYIMRFYEDPDGYTLGLYVGYYKDQTEGSIIHSPKHCMPGSGWEPYSSSVVTLDDTEGQSFRVNRMVLQKGLDKQLAYYWYHGRGRVIANEYVDRAYMVIDSIVSNRSDGALVRITGPGNDIEKFSRKQVGFMSALIPILNQFLPR